MARTNLYRQIRVLCKSQRYGADSFLTENPSSDAASSAPANPPIQNVAQRSSYWDGRFSFTIVILILIALLAGYLQYSYYPAIMAKPPFLEWNITLHLSPFSYAYNATRCVGIQDTASTCPLSSVQNIIGVPAFDFFQLFVAIVILASLYHLWTYNKKRS